MEPPLTIGLTGAIASGKSTALGIFGRLGAATISADEVVHELLDVEPLASRVRERWGDEVYVAGRVDRAKVGGIVFGDPEELHWLESELHPLVRERLAHWLQEAPEDARAAVAEIPLLFEGGLESAFDVTVAVTTPDELRSERAAERGQALTPERERRQLPAGEKAARADHQIVNDGKPEDLEQRIAALLDELTG